MGKLTELPEGLIDIKKAKKPTGLAAVLIECMEDADSPGYELTEDDLANYAKDKDKTLEARRGIAKGSITRMLNAKGFKDKFTYKMLEGSESLYIVKL